MATLAFKNLVRGAKVSAIKKTGILSRGLTFGGSFKSITFIEKWALIVFL